jgi:hypothetical protein
VGEPWRNSVVKKLNESNGAIGGNMQALRGSSNKEGDACRIHTVTTKAKGNVWQEGHQELLKWHTSLSEGANQ